MTGLESLNLGEIIATIVYTGLGLGLLILCWAVVEWLTPFSLRREIEEDQNLAVAVLMGAAFIALAIIIAAVILS